jgi:hypothetical protein
MRKREEGIPLPDRLAAFARSLTLTRQERTLVGVILLSMLVGSLVMHYRRAYHLQHPAAASPPPRHSQQSFERE